MNLKRANRTETHLFSVEALLKRTALIAEEDGILSTLEYHIVSHTTAVIERYTIYNRSAFDELIEELRYWSPFVLKVRLCDEMILEESSKHHIKHKHIEFLDYSSIIEIDILDVLPEQLSVDQNKVDDAMTWINTPEDIVVCCVKLGDRTVCIDGYSRLIAGLRKGIKKVYVYYDQIEDLSFYETCFNWCKTEGILSLNDLDKRVVVPLDHQRIWIDRCQTYLRENHDERD